MKFQNEYVTPDVALRLKEIGYDDECGSWYIYSQDRSIIGTTVNRMATTARLNWNTRISRISAPSITECLDWFREKNNLDVYVIVDCNVNEILGHTGYIHRLMAADEPFYIKVSEEGLSNWDYYKVLNKTILEAINYLENGSNSSTTQL